MTNFNKSEAGLLVPVKEIVRPRGAYIGTILRGGHFDDNGVWHRGTQVIEQFEDQNVVVDEGLNHMLDVTFHGSTQVTTWYIGVFEGNYTPVAADNAAGIAAAATESTAYASSTRPAYVEAAAASKVTTNAASRASFVFNATKTIYGALLISNSTKGGSTGTLMSAVRFSTSKNVDNNDELLLTYSFTMSSL